MVYCSSTKRIRMWTTMCTRRVSGATSVLFRFAIQSHSAMCGSSGRWQGWGSNCRRALFGIPISLGAALADAVTDQCRLFPRNIVIGGLQELAGRIPHPFLRKECDRILLRHFRSFVDTVAGESGIQCRRQILSGTQRQMSNLRGSRIYFNEVGVPRMTFQHEIESVKPREVEPAGHLLRC